MEQIFSYNTLFSPQNGEFPRGSSQLITEGGRDPEAGPVLGDTGLAPLEDAGRAVSLAELP